MLRILKDSEEILQRRGVLPTRLTVFQIAVDQLGRHDVAAIDGKESSAGLLIVLVTARER